MPRCCMREETRRREKGWLRGILSVESIFATRKQEFRGNIQMMSVRQSTGVHLQERDPSFWKREI